MGNLGIDSQLIQQLLRTWDLSLLNSTQPGESNVLRVEVDVIVRALSLHYITTLMAIGYIFSLAAACATIQTAWTVIVHDAKIPKPDSLAGPLAVIGAIVALRSTFPSTPVVGTSFGKFIELTSEASY